jgi:hypothetical protein
VIKGGRGGRGGRELKALQLKRTKMKVSLQLRIFEKIIKRKKPQPKSSVYHHLKEEIVEKLHQELG